MKRVTDEKTIVVLGMHRTATSLIARAVARDFPAAPTLIPPSASQPEGHWEDETLVALNDRILNAAGGTWSNPPPPHAIESQRPHFTGSIQRWIHIRNLQGPIWTCKDPRLCLTITLYAPHLRNPIYVATFRDPHETAESLKRRNNIPPDQGLRLAAEYNRRLLHFLTTATRCAD